MKYTFFSILIFMLGISSCKKQYKSKEAVLKNIFIDTILTLDSLNFFQSGNPDSLTLELAHKTLLEYFTKREHYYPQEKISLDSLITYPIENEDLLTCIDFDTLYKVHLNRDNVLDGIVTYWEMPCGASGNCWQPHRAVIMSINKKFTIINTDFIPKSYLIDSIVQDHSHTFIHGKVYDCSNHKYINTYRASIETQ